VIIPGEETPERDSGRWRLSNGAILFTHKPRKHHHSHVETCISVKWGGAFYLVPLDGKQEFIAHIDKQRSESPKILECNYLRTGYPNDYRDPVLVPKRFLPEFVRLSKSS
jgi:hypothetical protein